MILEVTIENILSFKDKVTFDFTNVTAIIGNNNSGKTNLLKILNLVSLMIKNNTNNLNSFMYNNDISSFEITFITNDKKYTYGFTFTKNNIIKEYLYCYEDKVKTIIYRRDNNYYDFQEESLKAISNRVLNNRLFLSYSKDLEKLKDIYHFLTYNIGVCFDINNLIELSFKIYIKDINNKLKPYILDFFKKIDINIIDYKVTSIKLGENIGYSTKFKHTLSNKNYIIDYGDEALSIRYIFALIPFVLRSIEENKVLIIDDLDSILDNKIIIEIIDMFNKGQLIFTYHNNYKFTCNIINLKKSICN